MAAARFQVHYESDFGTKCAGGRFSMNEAKKLANKIIKHNAEEHPRNFVIIDTWFDGDKGKLERYTYDAETRTLHRIGQ